MFEYTLGRRVLVVTTLSDREDSQRSGLNSSASGPHIVTEVFAINNPPNAVLINIQVPQGYY